MRKIEIERAVNLFSIIPDAPGGRIYHLAEDNLHFISLLRDFLVPKELEYQLMITNKGFFNVVVSELKKSEYFKIKELNLTQKRYNFNSKLYDFVIITINLEKNYNDELFKKIYRIMVNAAYVIIFTPQNLTAKVEELLVDTNFVAINRIDIFDNLDVISAKKLHGWQKV